MISPQKHIYVSQTNHFLRARVFGRVQGTTESSQYPHILVHAVNTNRGLHTDQTVALNITHTVTVCLIRRSLKLLNISLFILFAWPSRYRFCVSSSRVVGNRCCGGAFTETLDGFVLQFVQLPRKSQGNGSAGGSTACEKASGSLERDFTSPRRHRNSAMCKTLVF